MFVPGALGDPPSVDQEDACSLDNDSQHDPACDRQHDGAFETQSVHEIHDPPNPIRGSGGSGVYSKGREVQSPYLWRKDIGTYGIYVGNWSGRRKEQAVNDHIAADLVARAPAQILIAQEVDPKFVRTLRSPSTSAEAKASPWAAVQTSSPAVAVTGVQTSSPAVEGKGKSPRAAPRIFVLMACGGG